MAQIVIVDTADSDQAPALAIETLDRLGMGTAAWIGRECPAGVPSDQFLSTRTASLTSCLRSAMERSTEETAIILNAQAELSANQLKTIVATLGAENSAALRYMAIETQSGMVELAANDGDNLLDAISTASQVPFAAMMVKKSLVRKRSEIDGDSMAEIITKIMILAESEGEEIERLEQEYSTISGEGVALNLSSKGAARCLKILVENCNIEELFPNHPWGEYQAESIAACYHTLAAMFLRFGDLESANECLAYSERLEDSPRALALRGLIASQRGETLGAVANMISSLQQYEVRKTPSENHYLNFEPKNLEDINSTLLAGLDALNKRNNELALKHFKDAVFQFDPFYTEIGVSEKE